MLWRRRGRGELNALMVLLEGAQCPVDSEAGTKSGLKNATISVPYDEVSPYV